MVAALQSVILASNIATVIATVIATLIGTLIGTSPSMPPVPLERHVMIEPS